MRRFFEKLAWRLAGVQPPWQVWPTSAIKIGANPVEIRFQGGERLLLISPHPDDEVIGCGGLLLQALQQQAEIWVLYLTDGGLGGDPARRRQEAQAVQNYCAQKLGRSFTPYFLDLPELGLEPKAVQAAVRQSCQELNPHYLIFPHPGDNHQDHRTVARAIVQIAQDLQRLAPLRFLGYEIWQPLRLDAFVDITPWGESKRQLIQLYESQKRPKDYADMILALNLYRASCLPGPVKLAEALEFVTGS